jgi:hypothetical protein
VIFSESVDTDISLTLASSPGCRRADLADVKQLGLKVRREDIGTAARLIAPGCAGLAPNSATGK